MRLARRNGPTKPGSKELAPVLPLEVLIPEALFGSTVSERMMRRRGDRTQSIRRLKILLIDGENPWIIDLATGSVDRNTALVDCVLTTDAATLLNLVNGTCEIGTAVKRAKIRLSTREHSWVDPVLAPSEFSAVADAFMSVLRD